jgi:hypothetical protein
MSDSNAGGTHSYYDWQVSTLLLAYDAIEPLSRNDVAGLQKRQADCEHEVREIALTVIPADYQRDPVRELPAEVVVNMTRATLRRAAEIVGVV